MPGTVRVSSVMRASSGTELVLSPPWIVPTFMRGPAHHRVRLHREVEMLEVADHLRHLHDRVVAHLGHRAVRGHAMGLDLEPREALVADVGIVGRGLRDHDGAGARRGACGRRGNLAPSQPISSPAVITSTRPGPARELRRELDRRHDERGDAALHVGGAAAVEAVAVGLARERIAASTAPRPSGTVSMWPVKQMGARRVVAADLGDEAGARFGELVVLATRKPASSSIAPRCARRRAPCPGGLMVLKRSSSRVSARGSRCGHGIRVPAARARRLRRCAHQWLSASTPTENAEREVDVALRDVEVHAVGDQHHADHQQEGQRQHLHGRVRGDEVARAASEATSITIMAATTATTITQRWSAMPDRGDHRVEREDDVDDRDLRHDRAEACRRDVAGPLSPCSPSTSLWISWVAL